MGEGAPVVAGDRGALVRLVFRASDMAKVQSAVAICRTFETQAKRLYPCPSFRRSTAGLRASGPRPGYSFEPKSRVLRVRRSAARKVTVTR